MVTAANTPFIIDKRLPRKPMQMGAVPPSGATTRKVVKKRIGRSRKGKARSTTRTS